MFLPIMPNFVMDVAKSNIKEVQALRNGDPYTIDMLRKGYNPWNEYIADKYAPPDPVVSNPPVSAPGVYRSKVKPQTIDYLNADLAKHYGLSRATAYQEALSNTAYQRAVADMKAAGLNPSVLFGSGKGSSADGVGYVSQPGSRSHSARSYGSSKKSDSKLFSGSTYSAMSMIGGLIGMMVTGKPDGFWIGSQTAQGAMGLADSVSRR